MATPFTNCRSKFNKAIVLTIAFVACISSSGFSQSKIDSLLGKLDPQKLAASITAKSKKLEDKLVAKSMKELESMEKRDDRMYRKFFYNFNRCRKRFLSCYKG